MSVRLGELTDSSLIARRLTETQFHVVGAPSYFDEHGRPRTLDDLAAHNCLEFTVRDTRLARDWRFLRDGAEITVPPRGTMRFADGGARCDVACASLGPAQIHGYYIDAALAAGRLEPVEKFKPKSDPVWLLHPKTRHLSPRVRAFVDFTVARFK